MPATGGERRFDDMGGSLIGGMENPSPSSLVTPLRGVTLRGALRRVERLGYPPARGLSLATGWPRGAEHRGGA